MLVELRPPVLVDRFEPPVQRVRAAVAGLVTQIKIYENCIRKSSTKCVFSAPREECFSIFNSTLLEGLAARGVVHCRKREKKRRKRENTASMSTIYTHNNTIIVRKMFK